MMRRKSRASALSSDQVIPPDREPRSRIIRPDCNSQVDKMMRRKSRAARCHPIR